METAPALTALNFAKMPIIPRSNTNDSAAALEQERVAPDVVELGDSLAATDFAEATT
jgi:hypothetical protein